MILTGMVKHFQSPQNSEFAMSLQDFKKRFRDIKLAFCMQIDIKFPAS